MKKTYKTYEAPKAEVIDMQMPTVLMASNPTSTHGTGDDGDEFDLP